VGLTQRHRCHALYQNLTALVTDLDPYFAFVACTKQVLGPPRRWTLKAGEEPVGQGQSA